MFVMFKIFDRYEGKKNYVLEIVIFFKEGKLSWEMR